MDGQRATPAASPRQHSGMRLVSQSRFLTTHVTAVHVACHHLFMGEERVSIALLMVIAMIMMLTMACTGIGDMVEVVHLMSRQTIAHVVPLPGYNVTGIYSYQSQSDDSLMLAVTAARFLVLYKYENGMLTLTGGPVNLLDWILHVSCSGNSLQQLSLQCITSRNQLLTSDCCSGIVKRVVRCPVPCIIYSAHVLIAEPGLNDTDRRKDRAHEIIVASGTVFKEIVIWDASPDHGDEGKLITRLAGHEGVIFAVKFNRQNNLLASASDDRSVKIWKAGLNNVSESGFMLLFNLFNHSSRIWSIDFHDSTVISCGESGNICLWSLTDGSLLHKDECGDSNYWCLSVCQESGYAFCGSSDGSVYSFSIPVRTVAHSTRESVTCSPKLISFVDTDSGCRILSVNECGLVVLWDEEMQHPVVSHQLPSESFSNAYIQMTKLVAKKSDCCFMFGGECGKMIKLVFDQDSLRFREDYETSTGFTAKIVCLTSSSSCNGKESRVAACDSGNWLHLFQTETGGKLLTLSLHHCIHVLDRGSASLGTEAKVTTSSNTFETRVEENKQQLSYQVTRKKEPGSRRLHAIKRWPSCSLTGSGYLIIGDVSGNVKSFAWDPALQSSSAIPLSGHQVKETASFNRIHGPKGVTVLHRDESCSLIYSAGRDGKIRIWMLRQETIDGHCTSSYLTLMRTFRNFAAQLSWIGDLLFTDSPMSQASQKNANELRYVIGFVADKFVIYDDANESTLLKMGCGGGHRCWDALVSHNRPQTCAAQIVTLQTKSASRHDSAELDGSDITRSSRDNKAVAHFAYIKEKRIIWVSKEVEGEAASESETTESLKSNDMRVSNHEEETSSRSWPRRIRETHHTDQITCCIALSDRVTCEATRSLISGSRSCVLFVTGSEDAHISIYSYTEPHASNGSVVKKLTTLTGHISSVRTLCSYYDADRKDWIMISAGGRSQLMVWSIERESGTKESGLLVQQLLNHFLWNPDRKKSDQTIESSTNEEDQQEPDFQIRFTDCRIRKLIQCSDFNDSKGKVVSKAPFDHKEAESFQILTTSSDGKIRIFKLTLGKESRNISMIFLIAPHTSNSAFHAGMQQISMRKQLKQKEENSAKLDAELGEELSDSHEKGMAHASCMNRISLLHDHDHQNNGDKECGDLFITGSNSGHLQIWSNITDAVAIDHRLTRSNAAANYDSVTGVRNDLDEEEIKMDASRKNGEKREKREDGGESGAAQVRAAGCRRRVSHISHDCQPLAGSPLVLMRSSNPGTAHIDKPEGSSSNHQLQFLVQARNQDADIRSASSIVTCAQLLEAETSEEEEEEGAAGNGDAGIGSDLDSAYIISSTSSADQNHLSRYRHRHHNVSQDAGDSDDCISRFKTSSHSDRQQRKSNESGDSFQKCMNISCCGEIEHREETDTSFNPMGMNGADQSSPAAQFEAAASESCMLLHPIRCPVVTAPVAAALKSLSLHCHIENQDECRLFLSPTRNDCMPRDQSEARNDGKQSYSRRNVSDNDGNCNDCAPRYGHQMSEGKTHQPPEQCLRTKDTWVQLDPVKDKKRGRQMQADGKERSESEDNDSGGNRENDGQEERCVNSEAGDEKDLRMRRGDTPASSLSCTADYSGCQAIAAHQTGLMSLDTKHLLFHGKKSESLPSNGGRRRIQAGERPRGRDRNFLLLCY